MKIKVFLIVGIVILGIAVLGYFRAISAPKDTENLPKIEVSPQFFDFGEIKYGDIVNRSFIVKNTGKTALAIKKVATSCGCTTAKISKELIEPGQAAELQVVYDSGQMSGPHGMGRQERIIYVKSDDPINPQTQVIIYGTVK